MSQVQSRRLFGRIGTLQIAIIILVAITALIHLQRGIGTGAGGFGGGPGGPPGGFTRPPGGGFTRPPGGGSGGAPGGFAILQALPLPLSTLFLLNGIGYLVLVVALYLPALYRYQRVVRWLLIIFAAVTFVLYFVINGFHLNPISIVAKAAEIALIVLLFIEDRQSVRSTIDRVPEVSSA
jgi:hypothetical protein